MNVLSLCDGMSCGQIALRELNIPIDNYYASEIKDIAIKATQTNFPDTIQIGDVTKIRYDKGILYTEKGNYKVEFDLVIYGSPCQSCSRAMKKKGRVGLKDKERSGLFYDCYRVLQEVKPKYFLMENVVMNVDDEAIISEKMGVNSIRINSSLVSAQLRDRLYWTNIPNVTIPFDKGIILKDVIQDGYTPSKKARVLLKNDSHGFYNGCSWNSAARFYRWYYKSFNNMIFTNKSSYDKCVERAKEILGDRKPSADIFNTYKGEEFKCARYLWKEERARLQTVPEKYVQCMTELEAADLLGDGWTIDVIKHIFKGLQEEFE